MMNDLELDQILDTWEAPTPPPSLRRGLMAALPPQRRKMLGVPLRWIVAVAAAALPVAIGTSVYNADGQIGVYGQGGAYLGADNLYVRTSALVKPPIAAVRWAFMGGVFSIGHTPDGEVHGVTAVHSRSAKTYYGCEYHIRRVGLSQYRVWVTPLTMAELDRGSPFATTDPITPMPEIPQPIAVADGGKADIEVYRSGSERLFVRFELDSKRLPGANCTPFRDDQLRLDHPKLTINGAPTDDTTSTAIGATVWVRLPGRPGRYLIALDPMENPNFVPNGRASGKTIEFTAGKDQVRIDCISRVATKERALYVFEDTGFELQMKAGQTGPRFGSAGPACYFNNRCMQGQ